MTTWFVLKKLFSSFFISFIVFLPTIVCLGGIFFFVIIALSFVIPEEWLKETVRTVWGFPIAYLAWGLSFAGTFLYKCGIIGKKKIPT